MKTTRRTLFGILAGLFGAKAVPKPTETSGTSLMPQMKLRDVYIPGYTRIFRDPNAPRPPSYADNLVFEDGICIGRVPGNRYLHGGVINRTTSGC